MRFLRWLRADFQKPWGTTLDYGLLGAIVVSADYILITNGARWLLIWGTVCIVVGLSFGIVHEWRRRR